MKSLMLEIKKLREKKEYLLIQDAVHEAKTHRVSLAILKVCGVIWAGVGSLIILMKFLNFRIY
jgi:hypothetical protein